MSLKPEKNKVKVWDFNYYNMQISELSRKVLFSIIVSRMAEKVKAFYIRNINMQWKSIFLKYLVKLLCQICSDGFDLLIKSMNRSPLPRPPLMHQNHLKYSWVCNWGSFIRLLLKVIQWFSYDITQITHYIHGNRKAKMQHCIMQIRLDKP